MKQGLTIKFKLFVGIGTLILAVIAVALGIVATLGWLWPPAEPLPQGAGT